MPSILDGYEAAATADFIARYENLSPAIIYQHVSDLFPRHAARVADIGAGTGRDAAWFAAQGHQVLAVEPVRTLREAGCARHGARNIRWIDDRLPHLVGLRGRGPFDLITLCAVWQHLGEDERVIAMGRLAALLTPGGRVILSLRHGPGAPGRTVFPVSTERSVAAGVAHGLRLIRRRDADSVQPANQAKGVKWTWLVLEKTRPRA